VANNDSSCESLTFESRLRLQQKIGTLSISIQQTVMSLEIFVVPRLWYSNLLTVSKFFANKRASVK